MMRTSTPRQETATEVTTMQATARCLRSAIPLVSFVCVVLLSGMQIQGAEDNPTGNSQAETRQARMDELFRDVRLQYAQEPARELARMTKPMVKYTNPLNSSQLFASSYLWLDGNVPVAVVSPSFRDSGTIYWEWTSLSPQPLVLKQQDRTVWEPTRAGHVPQNFLNAAAPADSPAARLTQMRSLARRFNVTEVRRETTQEARLLTQPLHRWEDRDRGVIDAALFAFVEATDPELLLLLTAQSGKVEGSRVWTYTCARMTSSPCTVKLDEETVWTTEGYWKNPRSPQDPYIEASIGKFDVNEFFR